jgi:hypothetical protein
MKTTLPIPPPYWNGCCSWCRKPCEPAIVIHEAVYCSIACENEADDPPPPRVQR